MTFIVKVNCPIIGGATVIHFMRCVIKWQYR